MLENIENNFNLLDDRFYLELVDYTFENLKKIYAFASLWDDNVLNFARYLWASCFLENNINSLEIIEIGLRESIKSFYPPSLGMFIAMCLGNFNEFDAMEYRQYITYLTLKENQLKEANIKTLNEFISKNKGSH